MFFYKNSVVITTNCIRFSKLKFLFPNNYVFKDSNHLKKIMKFNIQYLLEPEFYFLKKRKKYTICVSILN